MINHQDQPHGVDVDTNDKDRLVGFVIGKIDKQKHTELLQKSAVKYKQYVKDKI